MGIASRGERLVSYPVRGSLNGLQLDLGDADVVIARGGRRPAVEIQRREKFAFDHSARATNQIDGGVFMLRSRCPITVLHSCSVRYRVVVPDNVPIDVRTGGGDVRLHGYRGSARIATDDGNISVDGFCGFLLQARTETGDVAAASNCPPPQLSLRSTSGDVHATVPAGRYQVDAASASGALTVRDGVVEAADAPFSIEVLSSSGDVLVEGRRR
jgi:hypothetical protein